MTLTSDPVPVTTNRAKLAFTRRPLLDSTDINYPAPNLAKAKLALGRTLLSGERRGGAGMLLIADGHRSTTRRAASPTKPKTHVGQVRTVTEVSFSSA